MTQFERPLKSTTDRAIPIGLRALKLWFSLESRFAPTSAESRAARMFVTPPRHKRRASRHYEATSVSVDLPTQNLDITDRQSGVRVSATTFGDGPLVMLLHGWGGAASDMVPLASAFASAGHRSVVFDMPGHGRSPGRESSLVEFMRAMRAVVGALGMPEIIVGHSFGGSAAVFGITELGFPVRRAVLISPAPGPAYYVDRFTRTIGLPPERAVGMMRRVVERVGRSVESLDALVAARTAAVPAIIFHDPADREVPYEFAVHMADAWTGSRLVPAPSLGHKRILRDPATIAAAVDFAGHSERRCHSDSDRSKESSGSR
jgi:pimeloyl-ACP methyl ester carboxylesterase